MKHRIGLTMGDPAGIGPEITVETLADSEIAEMAELIVFGDREVLEKAREIAEVDKEIRELDEEFADYDSDYINLYDMDNIDIEEIEFGQISGGAGQASFEYIERACQLALEGRLDGIVTGPINKESLKAGGVDYIGHTEMLGDLTDTDYPLTMFEVHDLRIFFLTRHLSLREACDQITEERVYENIVESNQALERLGIYEANLAVAALNPHGGERGLFGTEEMEEIKPAVERARQQGYDVEGPLPADSVFHFALQGQYDAVISLYHDQGHIAAKMVDFERTVSLTNNLPFLRTSVDHGTAFDIAGEGIASPVSLKEAIRVGARYIPCFQEKEENCHL
ncbi:4-hydroxythreonine-4-phosphate dehydrogenase PdxA [Halarsenatibacter silvermanii]|uniref:4-hydroxythreonine-4-phosphate dehydrogenase n=1 Tax=Halarsenatibacter silvermanii TaxID=321763 RepID=A0A1G9H862_9FIRM|nr:4-hydroxythreonine-4-phosphate dehydrogenase PdxA [Halarsenatibacter silvermanii]SDL09171.1 4-hydroxythreonine-4-phosphate dehydrogenase [Halarsenatibacter silvermanii]